MLAIETEYSLQEMPDGQNYRILLVSEDALIRFTLQNFFKDSDITVIAAAENDDGLRLLLQEKFDAVISELCSNAERSILFRRKIRGINEKMPILFMTPLSYWSDVQILDRIVEDPHSYYIPENADRKFMTAKLRQVISACQAENSLNYLKEKITRNWFLAGLLQQAMLPPWVYFGEKYEFSCLYRPFTRVSGDLFEWLPLDEDRALFVFGDISGHGTHSALAMAAVQSFLKQIILHDKEKGTRPSLIAGEINGFFCNHLHNIVHMGALIAYIDFKNNYIRYQNAGYMDMICVDAETGRIENANPEGKGSLALGLIKDNVYTDEDNVEFHFPDSAVFLFCSDGLADLPKDNDGETGVDMKACLDLVSMLVTDAKKNSKSIAVPFRAYHTLQQFGYLHPRDDLSMVLIRKPMQSEQEYSFSCRVPADQKMVDEICQRASTFVTKRYNDDELSVNTELLLEEYLLNVILHGLNEYEKLNDYLAIRLCAGESELKLIVWDHGKEWNGFISETDDVDEKFEQLNRDMATSGRGLPIISKIASHISRQRYSGLNESIFIVPVKKSTQAEDPNMD